MNHPDLRSKRQQAFENAAMDVNHMDYDLNGIPASRSSSSMGTRGSSTSGLFNRIRGKVSSTHAMNSYDMDEGYDGGMAEASFADISAKDLSALRDRHRYPAFDDNASRVSFDSQSDVASVYHAPQDSTPIIPTFGSTPSLSKSKHTNNMQYRQKLIESRRQLLSNELYGAMPPAPVRRPAAPNMYPRTMSLGGVPSGPGFGPPTGPLSGPHGPNPNGPNRRPGPGPGPYGQPPRSMSRMSSSTTDVHSPLSREVLPPSSELAAANRELEEQVRVLNAQLAQASQQAPRPEHVENLQAANRQLEDQVEMLTAQLAGLSQPDPKLQMVNRDLEQKVSELQAQLHASHEAQTTLAAQQARDAQAAKMSRVHVAKTRELEDEIRELHAQLRLAQSTPAVPAASTDDSELRETNAHLEETNSRLEEEVKVLTVELAESARRELGLDPVSDAAVTAQELAKLQDMLLIERQRHDGKARSRYSSIEAFTELEHKHTEATQLLEVRSQELEQLRERTKRLTAELAAADERADTLAVQARELPIVKAQLEQSKDAKGQLDELTTENDRLRDLLNQHASSGAEERLKVADKQREALQEALRSLRERKDQEIVVMQHRIEQLEERLARFAPATTRSFSLEEYQNSADSSSTSLPAPLMQSQRRQLSISTKAANENEDFEPPRVRQPMRPASPLHLNFGLNEPYTPASMRSVSRTATVPLALGGN